MNNFGLKFTELVCEQGTPEWFDARAGRITGSMIKTVRTKLRSGDWSASALKYGFKLAFERVAKGVLDDTYSNAYMKRGSALEEDARRLHEAHDKILVIETGTFISECGRYGASPDGLIGADSGVEYKCFISPDELKPILIDGDISTVADQVQFNMLATGRSEWQFFLYTPQLAGVTENPFKKYTIKRDEAYITEMLDDLKEFELVIEGYAEIIRQQYGIGIDAAEYKQPELDVTDFDIEF